MDKKGKTIAILSLPNGKTIVRENWCSPIGNVKIKIFGVVYESYHAEIRCILTVLRNSYFKKICEKHKYIEMTVLRYNKNGRLTPNSKPCENCIKVLSLVKEKKFGDKLTIKINYLKNGKLRTLII